MQTSLLRLLLVVAVAAAVRSQDASTNLSSTVPNQEEERSNLDADVVFKALNSSLRRLQESDKNRTSVLLALMTKRHNSSFLLMERMLEFVERRQAMLEAVIRKLPCQHQLLPDLCITWTKKRTNWTSADADCGRIGGRLLAFRNLQELKTVRKFVRTKVKKMVWLGHRYIGSQPFSMEGANAYNPPRSKYWDIDSKWSNECSFFLASGTMFTDKCHLSAFALCRRF